MEKSKFLPFLIASLALTAFLAGYIMISGGLDSTPRSRTGTILDKFGNPMDPASVTDSENESGQIKETSPLLISSVKTISVSNSTDRKGVIYFEKNTGKLFEFNFEDDKERIISNTVLPNFLSSTWSPVKKEVLSLFYSPNGNKIKYHNYDTGKTIDLDAHIRSAAFSPDGGLMTYYLAGTKDTNTNLPMQTIGESAVPAPEPIGRIYISQTDGTYPKKILDTRIHDIDISWPVKNKIAFSTPAAEIFLLTEEGGLIKLLESKPGLSIKWSKTGSKLLFSYLSSPNSSTASLWLKEVESNSEKDLEILAIAPECAWSIDNITIFCAVAKTPSVDEVYKINTQTGSQELIAEPNAPIADLFLTALENHLLFINTVDEKLYSIKISD